MALNDPGCQWAVINVNLQFLFISNASHVGLIDLSGSPHLKYGVQDISSGVRSIGTYTHTSCACIHMYTCEEEGA